MKKLTQCKSCGAEISKKAKMCPKCGEPAKKKTSLMTWLLLVLAGMYFITINTDTATPMDDNSTKMTKEEKALYIKRMEEKFKKEQEELKIKQKKEYENDPRNHIKFDFYFVKGGFGNVQIATFTINNKSKKDIKDIEVFCSQTSKSGANLGSNKRIIYDIVRAKKTKIIKDFNMGLIHSQTDRSSCRIVSFVYDEKRVWMEH